MKVKILGANNCEIRTDKGTFLQSYKVIVAGYINGTLHLDQKYHNYSKTTSKHITQWTGLSSKERTKGIKEGTILLSDLNQ